MKLVTRKAVIIARKIETKKLLFLHVLSTYWASEEMKTLLLSESREFLQDEH